MGRTGRELSLGTEALLVECWGGKWAGTGMGQKRARVFAFLPSGSFSSTLLLCMIASNVD